ncbi:MAG: hypothetical protein JNJ54_27905 [Myxococcaceae bacterium]|nr:hypothetical protein [Myxococcaceae bacterium]
MPSLELSAGTLRIGGEATISVTATVGEQPGTGTVALTASIGTLDDATVTLAEGTARTRLRCPRSLAGCAAGGLSEVTGRWMGPAGLVTRTISVRLVDPPVFDGSVPDAGASDGGATDGGVTDGGADAGPEPVEQRLPGSGLEFDAGSSLNGGTELVLGRLGQPTTVGFSVFSSTDVLLGFDSMPESPVIYADRLLYVRNGVVRAWTADELDGGPPEPDAGLDAGTLDAGVRDGGADGGADGGLDAGSFGWFPLRAPEWNDEVVASCRGIFGAADSGYVQALLPTRPGGLWLGCSEALRGPIQIFRNGAYLFTAQVPVSPLVANERQVLGVRLDGGLMLISATETMLVPAFGDRRFSGAGRSSPRGSFEVVATDIGSARCVLALIERDGGYAELPLPIDLVGRCSAARFDGRRDVLLAPIAGAPGIGGVEAVPFARMTTDAGRSDGGIADGGSDGGLDGGLPDAGLRFPAGPASDFFADPPTLSVDFTQSIEVVSAP